MDRTLIIVKPHAVARGLTGQVLARFEAMGLEIFDIKVVREDGHFWSAFYPSDDAWFKNVGAKTLTSCQQIGLNVESELGTSDPMAIGRQVKDWLVEHMSSGICVAVILQGNEAPRKARKACGATLPNAAEPGTIRFDFSCDSPALANREKRPVFNIVHASDPDETGAIVKEQQLVFGSGYRS